MIRDELTRREFLLSSGLGLVGVFGLKRAASAQSVLPNEIVISGRNLPGSATYTFSVTGELEAMTSPRGDVVSGQTATGVVHNWKDGYRYSGQISEFEHTGQIRVFINGLEVDPAEFDATGHWTERAPLPIAQSDAGGGVLDGKLYYFGGIETGFGLQAARRTFVYDPAVGVGGMWKRVENMPRALWGVCGVATNTELYSFGGAPTDSPYRTGLPPTNQIFVYRPGSGWTNLTKITGVRCPYRNWGMGGVYNPIDGLIYCLGGATEVTNRESATNHGVTRDNPGRYDESRVWTFDPSTGRVENPDLARMPLAKRWHTVALVEIDGRQFIHAIGGRLGVKGPTDSNYRFDIQTGEWRIMAPSPLSGNFGTTNNPVINNKVYLTHGFFWNGAPSQDDYLLVCHKYDPAADSYRTNLAKPTHPRVNAVAGVIENTLYVVGGHIKRYGEGRLHDCMAHNEAFTLPR